MSRLYGLARELAEYLRRRFERGTQADDAFRESVRNNPDRRAGAPPIQDIEKQAENYDQVELLGRDASYDPDDWATVVGRMKRVQSSNVYGYFYERESRTTGILYVTYLAEANGKKTTAPGATYAYYTVPARVFHRIDQAGSTGEAIWDNLRVRGTVWGHQFIYRLISVSGEYIPRKATRRGFRTRHLPSHGTGRREFRRSTLEEEIFGDGAPDRGEPDRGD